jgi:hypothetical protein
MNPLGLLMGYMLLTRGGSNGGEGGWRQLGPNSKGQYSVPAGTIFALDQDAGSPQAPIFVKQISDLGGSVLPPNVAVTSMPIDWPADDETRAQTGRMRAYGKFSSTQGFSLGLFSPTASFPVRVWVKRG